MFTHLWWAKNSIAISIQTNEFNELSGEQWRGPQEQSPIGPDCSTGMGSALFDSTDLLIDQYSIYSYRYFQL